MLSKDIRKMADVFRIGPDDKPERIDKIPEGAKQIHFYKPENILRPRGGRANKESLSLVIFEQLVSAYQSWTDPKYADSLTREEAIKAIKKNLDQEVDIAFSEFREET